MAPSSRPRRSTECSFMPQGSHQPNLFATRSNDQRKGPASTSPNSHDLCFTKHDGSRRQVVAELLEHGDVLVTILDRVLDGERPLLLAARRHEDAPVHGVEPGKLRDLTVLI